MQFWLLAQDASSSPPVAAAVLVTGTLVVPAVEQLSADALPAHAA